MSNKLQIIPSPTKDPEAMQRSIYAIKQNMEVVCGQKGDRIAQLPTTATTAEIIAKINEIIARLQGT